ncbi:MAG: DUF885 domain-containing protein [Rubrivivax sp.]|nr:DUF885 domain-containing protein [Rubrivivax sp.]
MNLSSFSARLRWCVAVFALAACPAWAASSFDLWGEAFAAQWMRLSPERSTAAQYFTGAEQDELDGQLSPPELERRQRQRALASEGLAQIDIFTAGTLTPSQQIDAATMRWSLQRSLAGMPFEDHGFAFNQLNGLQVNAVNFLTQTHPMRRPGDVQTYLARLRQLPARLDDTVARARRSAERGLLPPRFVLERARTQVEQFLAPAAADNLFVSALAERTASMASLDGAQRQQALMQAQVLVAEQVRPAYQRVLDLLNALHPRTNGDAGLWRLPDGAAAYQQALASNTTTALTADEIHAMGLRELARIEAEMDRVLTGLGRIEGSVSQRMRTLSAESQLPAEPDPRPMILARYDEYIRAAERRAAPLFKLKPTAPVEVRRVPALIERTASAYYTTPAPDGSRPGIFWVPLPGPVFNVMGMRSLAVHEAVPGHHFQLALQQEQLDLPRWRQLRVFSGGSAHSEGWALYAERLAIDEGWYEGDPHSLLGALGAQLFRARRLVVDTGLHAKRWTRQQSIDYGIEASEVERYVANPGQATAYMVGMLRILALREEARTTMGARFSLPGFHDIVLRAGSVPLDVLGDLVRRWATGPW